jgi:hypothetical protein
MIRRLIFSLFLSFSLGLTAGLAEIAPPNPGNTASNPIGIHPGINLGAGPGYTIGPRGNISMPGTPPYIIGLKMENSATKQNFSTEEILEINTLDFFKIPKKSLKTTVPPKATPVQQTAEQKSHSHSVYIKEIMEKKLSSPSSKFNNNTVSLVQ